MIDKRIAPTDDYYYCIGGLQRDSGWTWITGETFEYTNWGKNEPDGATKQWFLALVSTRVRTYNSHLKVGEWEDANNSDLHGFICEWELDIPDCKHTFTAWETLTEVSCFGDGEEWRICTHCGFEEKNVVPGLAHSFIFDEARGITECEHCGAAMYDGRIYKIFEINLSWFDACSYCASLGGHLATIASAEEQAFIELYMNSESFTEAAWLGAYNDGTSWHWITDEEFVYTNWAPGQPACMDGIEFFVEINSEGFGAWNDAQLKPLLTMYLICEWEAAESVLR